MQSIACPQTRLRNDLLRVKWDVKLYTLTRTHTNTHTGCSLIVVMSCWLLTVNTFRDVRNGYFKFGSISVQFWEKPQVWFGFLCRSVVKYKKKRVSCLSYVCILHLVDGFLNAQLVSTDNLISWSFTMTICIRQVQFCEKPWKPKFRFDLLALVRVFKNRNPVSAHP